MCSRKGNFPFVTLISGDIPLPKTLCYRAKQEDTLKNEHSKSSFCLPYFLNDSVEETKMGIFSLKSQLPSCIKSLTEEKEMRQISKIIQTNTNKVGRQKWK